MYKPVLHVAALASLFLSMSAVGKEFEIAPDWTLETASGESLTLSDVADEQPVVLMFWATWCPYCKALMPHLQSIRLEYGEDVRILAVAFRDDGDPAGLVADAGYDFTVFPKGDPVASDYEVRGTPRVLVLDRERRVHLDTAFLPAYDLPDAENASHERKGAWKSPYWAAEIRKALDLASD